MHFNYMRLSGIVQLPSPRALESCSLRFNLMGKSAYGSTKNKQLN